jgi:phosphohistidine phosphatase
MLAEYLKVNAIQPEVVLCSSSRRTLETLEGIGIGGRHVIEHGLYGASADELVARLRQVGDEVKSVMVIGHNPTMQTLVLRLASAARRADELAQVRAKFPTGALATLSLKSPWCELRPGRAQLTAFVRPKALARH